MTHRQRVIGFWLGAFVVAVFLFILFRPILLPFVAGAVLAYALDPLADRLEQRAVSRPLATLILLAAIALTLVVIVLLLIPLLLTQFVDLVEALPDFFTRLQELFGSALESDWARFFGIDPESIRGSFSAYMGQGIDLAGVVLGSLWTGGRAVVDVVSLLIVTPFVAYYLLRDWDRIVDWVDGILPRDQATDIRRLAREIDDKVAAFVRGQLLVGFLLGCFYAAGLMLIGLNYGLLVGLTAGVLSFIPYLGFAVGFAVSIAIAVVQYWPDWIWIAATVAVFMVGQLLEGYVLQPRFLGRRVGLHPVWLIFALFAAGYLFGFLGLLLAIPLAAAVGVLLRFAIERYRQSPLYEGTGRSEPK
jgi:predicted PurR-regulated permease PerM